MTRWGDDQGRMAGNEDEGRTVRGMMDSDVMRESVSEIIGGGMFEAIREI